MKLDLFWNSLISLNKLKRFCWQCPLMIYRALILNDFARDIFLFSILTKIERIKHVALGIHNSNTTSKFFWPRLLLLAFKLHGIAITILNSQYAICHQFSYLRANSIFFLFCLICDKWIYFHLILWIEVLLEFW